MTPASGKLIIITMGNVWISSWNHCDAAGKAIMVGLLFLSVYSWYILVEKFLVLKDVEKKNRLFVKSFKKGEIPRRIKCPLNSILEYGEELKVRSGAEYAEKHLEKAFLREQGLLEKKMTSLATIATIAPFLGLLGTVWGLLLSFMGIVAAGSSSVKVVAAGVSEALVTTVAGLLVAIPAATGYNYYRDRIFNILEGMEYLFPNIIDYLKRKD